MSDKESPSNFDTLKTWIFRIIALYLCWKCNRKEQTILRILYLLVAYFFSVYYLLFYALYHYILKFPCINAFGRNGVPTNL